MVHMNPDYRSTFILRYQQDCPSHESRESKLNVIWERIRRVFEYRIPVYQGVLGAAALVVLFFFIQNIKSELIYTESQNLRFTPETGQFTNVQVIHDLKIIDDQKIGRSVSEDTLLTKYVFSVM